jgi:hypothetical protein
MYTKMLSYNNFTCLFLIIFDFLSRPENFKILNFVRIKSHVNFQIDLNYGDNSV